MRKVHIDKDGNESVHYLKQVGPSSFMPDPEPPESGYCDHCGVAIDPRHTEELRDRVAHLEARLVKYEPLNLQAEADQEEAEISEEEEIYAEEAAEEELDALASEPPYWGGEF